MTDSPAVNSERDIAAIQHDQWPARALDHLTGMRETSFQVVYKQSVLDEIHLHGQSATSIEVCGVLVGTGHTDANGPYLLIDHCIRGNNAGSRATNVTFTADTWQHIQETMDRQYPDKKIVGWYHTHPGFGIFLSDMDIFICEHFFDLPWQSAFVYDPVGGEEGNFIWRNGRPEKTPVLVENDVTPAAAAIPLISVDDAMAVDREIAGVPRFPSLTDKRVIELLQRVRRLERRQKLMFGLLVFFVVFAAVWNTQFNLPQVELYTGPQPTTQPTPPAIAQPMTGNPPAFTIPSHITGNAIEEDPLKPRGQ